MQFRGNLFLVQGEVIMKGTFHRHGIILGVNNEGGRSFRSNFQFRRQLVFMILEREVSRIDQHGEGRPGIQGMQIHVAAV